MRRSIRRRSSACRRRATPIWCPEEVIKAYIREKRRSGIRINHMAVIIAAYYKAVQTNPKLNYFVMNSRIYKRNHFCVSFVILKKLADR